MKNLITILIIACGFIASAQTDAVPFLGTRPEASKIVGLRAQNTTLTGKVGFLGIIGGDTLKMFYDTTGGGTLTIDENVKLTELAGSGTGVVGINNAGLLSFTTTTSISPWTGNGTNVYLRDSTDNVGIGFSNPVSKLSVLGNAQFFIPNGGQAFSVLDLSGNTFLSVIPGTAQQKVIIGDVDGAFNLTTLIVDDGNSNVGIATDNLNISGIPTDSTGLSTGDIWVDVNGFIRRKF